MGLTEINEPIQVATLFKEGKITPLKFFWQNREFRVTKVNLSYHHFEGRTKVYYFAVSDNSNYFKLQFDSNSLNWTLLESYTE
jgi:hypothetical protein